MKRSYKIAIIAIVYLMFLYALSFLGYSIQFCVLEAFKVIGITLGVSVLVFIIGFLARKWLEE